MATRKKQTSLQIIRRTAKRQAKMAVVPHRANQFKPYLIRRHGLAVVVILVLLVQVIVHDGMFRNVLGAEDHVVAPELLAATNHERTAAGEQPLRLNSQLSDAAQLKAKDMLAHQYWDHTSPQGVPPWKWIDDVGYRYAYAGENLARNFPTSDAVVKGWMQSPSHRDNVLKAQYSEVGFAVANGELNGKPISLVVALYGTPARDVLAAATLERQFTSASIAPSVGILSRVGMAVQSMKPATLGSVALLLVAAIVALVAHAYRRHIPKYLQNVWQRHHGWVKAIGLSSIAIVVVLLYETGGQL